MNTSKKYYLKYVLTLLLGLGTFFFWWKLHPEALSWHEQNQLFLCSTDYLLERIVVPGGWADWLSEAIVQFFYQLTAGAALMALLVMALQLATYKVISTNSCIAFGLSFWPPVLLLAIMGDENVMLSYTIALLLSLITYLGCRRGGSVLQMFASLPLYWLVGPLFGVQVVLAVIDALRSRKTLVAVTMLLAAVAWVYACRTLWADQYPWSTVLAGISYHRLTLMMCEIPAELYGLALLLAIIPLLATGLERLGCINRLWAGPFTSLLGILLTLIPVGGFVLGHDKCYNPNVYAQLHQHLLIRKSDWLGIIEQAEKNLQNQLEVVKTPLYINGVNLALAQRGQLNNRLLNFPQCGMKGLIMPRVRDNMSNVTSMETFWHLSMINESMRYAFDTQESIPNCRKSGRYLQRMAECQIVNGNYEAASKYIGLLKQTLFYRSWAEIAETYLYNEEKIANYPEWGVRRDMRFKEDFLYYYPEMTKMLAKLVNENSANAMAYNYFMAAFVLGKQEASTHIDATTSATSTR
ncbi:MAG: DUF6057 family protein [Bacteroidales bacterium]|nr:DUF6057 family protein [Bacteroidales bacterium]